MLGRSAPLAGAGMSGTARAPGATDRGALRRQAFVDAAREAFFAGGYAATTMSSIAARVGGSKTTLWSYFPRKADLFVAVVDDIVERYGKALSADLPEDGEVEPVLTGFASLLLETILSPASLSLYRLVIAEADRFPPLAEAFYDRGPRRGKARLAAWIATKMDRGELWRGDPLAAAQQFVGLCMAGCFQAALFHLETPSSQEAEIALVVERFCGGWMRRHKD